MYEVPLDTDAMGDSPDCDRDGIACVCACAVVVYLEAEVAEVFDMSVVVGLDFLLGVFGPDCDGNNGSIIGKCLVSRAAAGEHVHNAMTINVKFQSSIS